LVGPVPGVTPGAPVPRAEGAGLGTTSVAERSA
jgi:hypothetical protein